MSISFQLSTIVTGIFLVKFSFTIRTTIVYLERNFLNFIIEFDH